MRSNIIFIILFSSISLFSQKTNVKANLKEVEVDSMSNIHVDKLIYYKCPLEFYYNELTDTAYIPQWYPAYCANDNLDYFSPNQLSALNYMSSSMGYTLESFRRHLDYIESQGGRKQVLDKLYLNMPYLRYLYIYSEMWLTDLLTRKKYVYIQGIYSQNKIPDLLFKDVANTNVEVTDTIKNQTRLTQIYSIENDTVKLIDQLNTIANTLNNNKALSFSSDIHKFKRSLKRSESFLQSEVINNKRIFSTMKKGKTGHQKIKESYKP